MIDQALKHPEHRGKIVEVERGRWDIPSYWGSSYYINYVYVLLTAYVACRKLIVNRALQ